MERVLREKNSKEGKERAAETITSMKTISG